MHKVIAKGKQLKHYKLTFLPYKGDLSSSGTLLFGCDFIWQFCIYSAYHQIGTDLYA